jgi:hypothetical protein
MIRANVTRSLRCARISRRLYKRWKRLPVEYVGVPQAVTAIHEWGCLFGKAVHIKVLSSGRRTIQETCVGAGRTLQSWHLWGL